MGLKNKVFFTFIIVIISQFSCAQSLDYKIGVLNNEINITNNPASAIYKDKEGFLWLGKMDGLYKYNGSDFEIYGSTFNSNRGLSNPWVTDVNEFEDYLILGTKNGLNFFNKETQEFSYLFPSEINSEFSNYITSIHVDSVTKQILMGTSNGLFTVKPKLDGAFSIQAFSFENSKELIDNPEVHQICKIPGGAIIRSSKGLYFIDITSDIAKELTTSSENKKILKNCNYIYLNDLGELLLFSEGKIYLENLKNSNIQEANEILFKEVSHLYDNWPELEKINVFLEDINGNIWIGTEGEGLYFYKKNTKTWKNYKYKINRKNVLKNDFIRSFYEDSSGLLFVGTDAGINTINTKSKRFQVIDYIKGDAIGESEIVNVHGLLQDVQGNLWVGTRGKGLFIIGKELAIAIKSDVNYALGHIRSIIQTKNKDIWIGTQKGIFILDKNKQVNQQNILDIFKGKQANLLSGENVYAILEDSLGNKWISTSNGLFVHSIKGETKKLTNISIGTSLDNKTIYTNFLDKNDRIWFGTLNGMIAYLDYNDYNTQSSLFAYTGKPLDFKVIKVAPQYKKFLENYEVYSICEVEKGHIMVGTNFGICRLDIDKKLIAPFSSLNSSLDSLNIGASYVYGLLYEKEPNNLWISSNNGLFTYNLDSKELERYGLKDGLQSLEFNGNSVYKGKQGNLIFGGAKGLNIYNPKVKLKKSDYHPNMVFTKLLINGKRIKVNDNTSILKKDISFTKKIQLNANQNTLGLEFGSLDLAFSSNDLYKCKLIGIDKDWIFLGNKRSINYANLPKGDYQFLLKGTNNDGVWNPKKIKLDIVILPAWYLTWWMILTWYLIGFLIIFSFLYILLKIRDNNNILKIKEIERNNLQELYESKLVFFTNLSHELRTPLSLIIDPIKNLINKKDVYSKNKELFNIVQNNVDRLSRLIDQIMDFRKHEYGKMNLKISKSNIVETLISISNSFVYHSKIKNIKYIIKLPKSALFMYYDADKIEKIVYNILSNAFKATRNGGKIRISLGEFNNDKKLYKLLKYKLISGTKDLSTLDNHIYIKVVDNGEGISAESLQDIFTRFYQDKSINSGTGIGLYMVKQLTEMHFGTILIKSIKNRGTSFIILLPKNDDLYKPLLFDTEKIEKLEEVVSADVPILKDKSEVILPPKKYNVVVVEDNDELRFYLKSILKDFYNVYTANNGLEGIELIKEEIPDLIISDVVMPEIDGLELCKSVKSNFDTSHIPVILLTAKSFDYQVVDGVKSGADLYLTKPFNSEILIANINNLIKNREKLRLTFQNENILEPSRITVTSIDEQFITKLKKAVEENIQEQQLTLESLATQVGVSRAQLFRKVKVLTGLTPNNFIKSIRIKYAAQLLLDERFQMSEVAFLSGFKEASYFSRCFKEAYGCSPKEYKSSQE